MRNLTIFDLDHTLLKKNSSYCFGSYLYRQRFFSIFKLLCGLVDYVAHKYGVLSLRRLHERSFKRLFQGQSLIVIKEHVSRFLDIHLCQLMSPQLEMRLQQAQQSGDYTLILSSSPDFLVSAIADRLSIDEWYATRYKTDVDFRFCSVDPLDGEAKLQCLQSLIKENRWHVDKMTVYSDSYLDLPLLNQASCSVGVNPDSILRKVCIEKGWEILDHD